MKEITKAEFINTWASEWDERTGWKVSEEYHKQFSEQLEYLINQEVEKRIAERMPSDVVSSNAALDYCAYPDIDGEPQFNEAEGRGFQAGIEWLRSRLAKTEGGGE